ncbi:hypothetical protein ACQUFY_08265 [Robbsia andropogonis]|uniref:hypothetical protein n=1 Tax=Robbsia andropogonis TaxID=28092 RepID=UPI003D219F0C
MTLVRKLIRASGEEIALPGPVCIAEAERLIGADTLSTVTLLDRKHVMLVDDRFIAKGLPVNAAATRLYHEVCVPGTTHQICGDVIVVPDSDYGSEL